jgi:deoxyxylulose-5-phosphate synthase
MALESIHEPADLRTLSYPDLDEFAGEIRDFVVPTTSSLEIGEDVTLRLTPRP